MKLNVLLVLSLAVGSVACSPSTKVCNASTCNGCCSADGQCQAGTATNACGRAGATCKSCGALESCLATTGSCIVDSSMTGGGSGGGSATGGGSSSGGGTASTGGGSATGGGSVNPTEVTGSCHEHWVSDADAGSTACVFTLSTIPQAVVPLADGGMATLSAQVFADGTFRISDVPPGPYFFKTGTAWFQTTQRQLVLSNERQGRIDTTLAGTSTTLSVQATGLTPWNGSTQFMSLYSSNSGAIIDGWTIGQFTPSTGVTSATFSIPYTDYSQQLGTPMIDSAKGDKLLFMQTLYDSASGEYRVGVSGEGSAVTMTTGQVNTTTVALTAPSTASLPLDITVSAFGMYANEFTTGLAPVLNVAIRTGPKAQHELVSDGWAFVWGSYPTPGGTPPALPNPVVFANPFSSTWGFSAAISYGNTVTRLMTGALESRRYLSGISMTIASQSLGSAVTPDLSTPKDVQVDTLPFGSNNPISRTPTVAWAAPTLGTPSRYVLRIEQLQLSSGRTTARAVASFSLLPTESTFTVPSGLLTTGQTYVFVLSAIKSPTGNARNLFETRLPLTSAGVVSGLLRP